MRRAIVRGNGLAGVGSIEYSLQQYDDHVTLEATVDGITQSLLLLLPHTIQKIACVSDNIELRTAPENKSVIVEPASYKGIL